MRPEISLVCGGQIAKAACEFSSLRNENGGLHGALLGQRVELSRGGCLIWKHVGLSSLRPHMCAASWEHKGRAAQSSLR
jgi:hypothetical protein